MVDALPQRRDATDADKPAIEAAVNAYNAMSFRQKYYFDKEALTKLRDLKESLTVFRSVKDVFDSSLSIKDKSVVVLEDVEMPTSPEYRSTT